MERSQAKKGSILIMASRGITVLCGFAIQVVCARALGPSLFGLFTVALSLLVWFETASSVGMPSAFRKILSEDPDTFKPILASLKRNAVPYSIFFGAVFAALSPAAAFALGEPALLVLLLIGSADVFAFTMHCTFTGILNGRGEFLRQSVAATIYSVTRAAAIIGAVLVGLGTAGAFLGIVVGSGTGAVFGARMVRQIARRELTTENIKPFPSEVFRRRLVNFGLPFMTSTLLLTVLINLDVWFVQAFSHFTDDGQRSVGYYGAAYSLARVPYVLIGAISVASFPAISRASSMKSVSELRSVVEDAVRIALLLILPMTVAVLCTSDEVIGLLFSSEFAPAAAPLRVLFAGVCAFSLFSLLANAVSAIDQPRFPLILSAALLLPAAILNYFLIRSHGIVGASIATASISLCALAVTAYKLRRETGALLDYRSTARIIAASLIMYGVFVAIKSFNLWLPVTYAIAGSTYLGALILIREINLRSLWRLFVKEKAPSSDD